MNRLGKFGPATILLLGGIVGFVGGFVQGSRSVPVAAVASVQAAPVQYNYQFLSGKLDSQYQYLYDSIIANDWDPFMSSITYSPQEGAVAITHFRKAR